MFLFSDIDECVDPSLFSCSEQTKCKNTPGGYECACESGFETVGGECEGTVADLLVYLLFIGCTMFHAMYG